MWLPSLLSQFFLFISNHFLPFIICLFFTIIISSYTHKSIAKPSEFKFLFQWNIWSSFSSIFSPLETGLSGAFLLPASIWTSSLPGLLWEFPDFIFQHFSWQTLQWVCPPRPLPEHRARLYQFQLLEYEQKWCSIPSSSRGWHWNLHAKDGRVFISWALNNFIK